MYVLVNYGFIFISMFFVHVIIASHENVEGLPSTTTTRTLKRDPSVTDLCVFFATRKAHSAYDTKEPEGVRLLDQRDPIPDRIHATMEKLCSRYEEIAEREETRRKTEEARIKPMPMPGTFRVPLYEQFYAEINLNQEKECRKNRRQEAQQENEWDACIHFYFRDLSQYKAIIKDLFPARDKCALARIILSYIYGSYFERQLLARSQ